MNVLNCCRKTKRRWLKGIHPCPLKTYNMNECQTFFQTSQWIKARLQKISPHYLSARYEPARAEEKKCESLEWLKKQMLSINVTVTSPDAAQTCSQADLIPHFCYRSQTTCLFLVRQLTLNRGGSSVNYDEEERAIVDTLRLLGTPSQEKSKIW